MKLKAEIEIKLRRFLKKYGKLLFLIFIIVAIIITIDRLLKNSWKNEKPSTTYEPQVSIMDDSKKVPNKVQKTTEEFISEYIEYCNKKDFSSAYDMLSEDCKKDYFGTITDYKKFIEQKFQTPKKYAIQSYSIYNDKYIYSVKLFEDFLATGLTNSSYKYFEDKIVASYDEKNKIVFSVGGFIDRESVESVQENDYLKVDVKNRYVLYEFEKYSMKLTNRSNHRIVIQNLEADADEIVLNMGNTTRSNELSAYDVILEPNESKYVTVAFSKPFDRGYVSKSIIFSSVRVFDEDDNIIDKFSMEMGF